MSAEVIMPGLNSFPSIKEYFRSSESPTVDPLSACREQAGQEHEIQSTTGRVQLTKGLQFPFLAGLLRKNLGGGAEAQTKEDSIRSSQTILNRQESYSSAEQQLGRGLKTLDLRSLSREEGPPTELQARREKFAYFENKCSEVASNIFVGGELVARNKCILRENGITHIINCVGMICPSCFAEDFTYLTLYLNDATGEDMVSLLYDVFAFIEDALRSGGRVFVHCSQGVSRSATFVIGYLMWKHNQPYDKTYQAVKAIRGVTNPNIGFTCQLLNWAKRRNGPQNGCQAYHVMPHSKDNNFPAYLVARQLPEVSPSILDPTRALVLRLPQKTYIWQGARCPEEHLAAAWRAANGMQRFEGAPAATLVHDGKEPAELLTALGAIPGRPQCEPDQRHGRVSIPQVTLSSVLAATGPTSARGEGSAPNSARTKTPREELPQGPMGLRSPNQRQRKVRRSDSNSEGPATARSRSSESIDEGDESALDPITRAPVDLAAAIPSSPQLRNLTSAGETSSPQGPRSPLAGGYRRSPRRRPLLPGGHF